MYQLSNHSQHLAEQIFGRWFKKQFSSSLSHKRHTRFSKQKKESTTTNKKQQSQHVRTIFL